MLAKSKAFPSFQENLNKTPPKRGRKFLPVSPTPEIEARGSLKSEFRANLAT
jgi:hypothetical protein